MGREAGGVDDPVEVRAAGGIVIRPAAGPLPSERPERPGPDGAPGRAVEVLVVHRPRYDDWSFPKGKVDPGESDEDCARREVEEETGLRCRLVRELAPVRYVDHRGRAKRVRYWQMAAVGGAFAPNDEVDEVRWLPPRAAAALLTYGHDARLLDALDPAPG